jgi:arsenate reductase
MVTIYGIPNCDTIKKTKTWFDQHHIPYSFHDYRKDRISKQHLQKWCKQMGWEQVLNKKSTSWRNLDAETQSGITSAAKAIAVLLEHPTLIKRPVIERDGIIVQIGFNKEALESLFL